jgi:DNA-binding beta-propeller fold protein YncE
MSRSTRALAHGNRPPRVEFDLHFYIERNGQVAGPVSDDDVRDAVRQGRFEPGTRVRLVGTDLWATPAAFATFAARRESLPPPETLPEDPPPRDLPRDLASTSPTVRDLLLFWLVDGARPIGPFTGEQIRRAWEDGRYRAASVALVDTSAWYPIQLLFGRDPAPATDAAPPSLSLPLTRCPVCLEQVPLGLEICSECGEPWGAPVPAHAAGPPSIPDDRPGASWLSMHWRPLVTLGAMFSVVFSGVALRYLAPDRFLTPGARASGATVPTASGCSSACWNGEACEASKCVWQKPNDVRHVGQDAAPTLNGPYSLPRDVSDAIPLDRERFAVALLGGLQVHDARSGAVISLVTEVPQLRKLFRVDQVVYATAPQRIFVIDAGSTRLLKTIELGSAASQVVVGAAGRRALASLPNAHAVAILATEYHAEIDRIQFGDDPVGPLGVDDTGGRGITATGNVPVPGYRESQGGAVYAFDPSRLASAQDRVRASLIGNPVSVLMTPDGATSYVVLRAEDALAPLAWLPSGAVRQETRIPTCREPEQIELVRRDRRAVVRCNEGRAIEIFDLTRRELVRRVQFDARVTDMVISPDGEQAILALPADGAGDIGIVNLKTFAVRKMPVAAEPTRVRLTPDGSMALVLSDRSKLAWVVR